MIARAGFCLVVLWGCSGMQAVQGAVGKLRTTVQEHAEHLRWKRFSLAEGQVAMAHVREFREKRAQKNREIVEAEVTGVELGRDKNRAIVRVTYRSYALPSNVVQIQQVGDIWIYRDGAWLWSGDAPPER